MGTVYRRYQKLWLKFKDREGKWVYRATDFRPGQEAQARKLLVRVEEKLAAGVEVEREGPVTVAKYAAKWIEDCRAMGIGEASNNASRLKHHVLSFSFNDGKTLGEMPIEDVRARHIAQVFLALRKAQRYAPKTIRNIYAATQGMFREAEVEGIIERSPCVLTAHHLGEIADKDPEWRVTAVYSRSELESLISDARVPEDRRVIYALEGIAGLRHGEVAALRVFHFQPDVKPLGRLLVARSNRRKTTKTGRPREVPVHPVLADVLARWLRFGWPAMMGRSPTPDDLLVPCPERPEFLAGRQRDKNYSRKRLIEDLKTLGFRHRRGHDLRRTMISLARMDGARKDLLETVTHTPAGGRTAIDVYTTYEWASLCGEVSKLRLLWWKGEGSEAPSAEPSRANGTATTTPNE